MLLYATDTERSARSYLSKSDGISSARCNLTRRRPSQVSISFRPNLNFLASHSLSHITAIPNLHTIQTLTSIKAASALNKALPTSRTSPLNILIQVNTSGELSKSGLPPLSSSEDNTQDEELTKLAAFIIKECPKLRLQGLMTIGALEQSMDHQHENKDFERLTQTKEELESWLRSNNNDLGKDSWGSEGRLLLSMGMSSDYEDALEAGSDIVRVGTGIFGSRQMK